MLSSCVNIRSFRGKAHLVFQWCLYNKHFYEWYSEGNKGYRMFSWRNTNFDLALPSESYKVECIESIVCMHCYNWPFSESLSTGTSMSHTCCYMWTNCSQAFLLNFPAQKKKENLTLHYFKIDLTFTNTMNMIIHVHLIFLSTSEGRS